MNNEEISSHCGFYSSANICYIPSCKYRIAGSKSGKKNIQNNNIYILLLLLLFLLLLDRVDFVVTPRLAGVIDDPCPNDFLTVPAMEMAKQLTHMDHGLFRKISLRWKPKANLRHDPQAKALTSHFNRLGYWVATEVIRCGSTKN